jgi:signal transduction histidine kinase
LAHDFQDDLDAMQSLEVVPSMLQLVRETTGMGFVAIARVTPERWVACSVLDTIDFGLKPGGELRLESTICHEIHQNRRLVAIDNVAEDPIWATHHTPLQYGFQSYISVPIIRGDGSFFGTLCAIDPKPASVDNPRVIGTLKLFADLIASHLDARTRVTEAESRLADEMEISGLRDQFIGILGHDIRNPIASIMSGAKILRKTVNDPRGMQVLGLMEQSIVRVANIVDNVMDFARGLSGGIAVRPFEARLDDTLAGIISEIEGLHPDRLIETKFLLQTPLRVDHNRIGQLYSNLLSNAIVHGKGVIRTEATIEDGELRLWVANAGEPILEEDIERLFQPFKRRGPNAEGLGLGLHIASQIAQAHGGRIVVRSNAEETRFTVNVPLGDSDTDD